MSILYDSNINRSLELKSSTDLITERIVNNTLYNYQPSVSALLLDATGKNFSGGETYDYTVYELTSNYGFNKVLSNTFQNIKAEGLDCFSLINNLNNFTNEYINEVYSEKEIQELNYTIGMPLDNLFVSFYKSSKDFDKDSNKNRFFIQKTARNHSAFSYIAAKHESLKNFSVYGEALLFDKNGNQNYINVSDESKKTSPHMSVTMINSPYIRGSLQNELEMHTFLNSYNSLEMSKCIPYLDVRMKIPRYNEKYEPQYRSNADIESFLYPDTPADKSGSIITNGFNSHIKKENTTIDLEEIYVSNFTMPQTAVNLNTRNYGRSENSVSQNTLDPITPHDLTRPFMSIKKLDLDVQTAGGLISHKSGTLSLILHDRARMRQIASFFDASLQGAYGPQVTIEFGWSHPAEEGNALGKFLNSAKSKEIYSITNSNFTMESDGSVNVDLFVAQISGRIFTKLNFTTNPDIVNNMKKVNAIIQSIVRMIGVNIDKIGTTENLNMFRFEYSNFNDDSASKIKALIDKVGKAAYDFMFVENYPFENLVEVVIGYKTTPEDIPSLVDIDGIIRKLTELREIIDYSLEQKKIENDKKGKSLFNKICPNIDQFDPFWDRVLWNYLENDDKLSETLGYQNDYITWGSIVSGLIATHLAPEHQFSDIQLYSYTCNSSCGYMSNRNIFSILIEKIKSY